MSLQIFCGPMYSSKTRSMIEEINRFSDISFQKVLIINHHYDNRDIKHIVSSHSSIYKGLSNNIDTKSTGKLSQIDVSPYTVIGIDEVNFFEEQDLLNTIKLWLSLDKHIICSGLDGDIHMNPFGYISKLLPMADKFVKLRAVCHLCVKELMDKNILITPFNTTPAPFTKKLIHDDKLIDIGGHDKYIAVCRKHF